MLIGQILVAICKLILTLWWLGKFWSILDLFEVWNSVPVLNENDTEQCCWEWFHGDSCVTPIVYLHWLFVNYANGFILWLLSWPISPWVVKKYSPDCSLIMELIFSKICKWCCCFEWITSQSFSVEWHLSFIDWIRIYRNIGYVYKHWVFTQLSQIYFSSTSTSNFIVTPIKTVSLCDMSSSSCFFCYMQHLVCLD